jgi:hypothetical protein
MRRQVISLTPILILSLLLVGCTSGEDSADLPPEPESLWSPTPAEGEVYLNQPLISHLQTADPSAHLFEGRIYIYPSHDVETGVAPDDMGSHFDMMDYHVFSMDRVGGAVVDHGAALAVEDVLWASRQLWAPDAAEKDGSYYLFFPAKDQEDVFRIGVAVADNPAGPFTPEAEPIAGSYSIDPAVFRDADGEHYMYFGGIWGGQLQRWETGAYRNEDIYPADDQPAIAPRVVKLSADLRAFAEEPREVVIQDENGVPILAGDEDRRFFEAAWVRSYGGKY